MKSSFYLLSLIATIAFPSPANADEACEKYFRERGVEDVEVHCEDVSMTCINITSIAMSNLERLEACKNVPAGCLRLVKQKAPHLGNGESIERCRNVSVGCLKTKMKKHLEMSFLDILDDC